MKYRIQFEYKGMIIKAKCIDINVYSETEGLRLSFTGLDDEEVFPDRETMEEIEEIVDGMLYDKKYESDLQF